MRNPRRTTTVALVVTGLSFTGVAAATAAPAVSTSTSSAVTTARTREAPGKDDLQRSASCAARSAPTP